MFSYLSPLLCLFICKHFAAATFASSTRISEASVIREFDNPNVGGNASVDLAAQGVEESIVDEFIAPHRSDLTVEGRPPSSRAEVATATFVSSRGISESSIVEEMMILLLVQTPM